jgi:heme oxygenase
MDLGLLRTATTPEHERVEALMPLMSANLTRADYIGVLQHIYPLLAGWELWAKAHAPAEYATLLATRQRSSLLASDLAHFGSSLPATHFPAQQVPALGESPAAFLGAMYVIEGSTLGGQHIARHIEPLLNLSADGGTAYFRGYGEHTGEQWREFKAALAAVPDEQGETLILAAKGMFTVFGEAILPLSQKQFS